MTDLPIVMSPAGAVPQAPNDMRLALVTIVTALTAAGYTADLPGSLIEDILSTDIYALLTCDSALVDLVNSITPLSANEWLMIQQGNLVGLTQAAATNTGVYVVFSGPPGYVVNQGFTVSDGQYPYIAQEGAIVGTSGMTTPIYCVSPVAGSWAVPANTVTMLSTSVPSPVVLTCTNPSTGVPGGTAQSASSFRAALADAWLAPCIGTARQVKTALAQVTGVQPRLRAYIPQAGGGTKIIVGGGDPYAVAYAIWSAIADPSLLIGSVMGVTGITNANPAVVTTTLNHGYVTGQSATMSKATGLTALNGTAYPVTVLSQTTFSVAVNTTSSGTYTGNGVMSPNARNVVPIIDDFPDSYAIPFVVPPQQTVAIAVTWNTSSPNFVNPVSVAQLAVPAIVAYVNAIVVGQPILVYDLETTFRKALKDILSPSLITRMIFAVSINGVGVAAQAGTGIIAGDPESFFYTTAAMITVAQG